MLILVLNLLIKLIDFHDMRGYEYVIMCCKQFSKHFYMKFSD